MLIREVTFVYDDEPDDARTVLIGFDADADFEKLDEHPLDPQIWHWADSEDEFRNEVQILDEATIISWGKITSI